METGKIPAEVDNYERRGMSAGIPFVPDAILGALGRLSGGLGHAFIAADCVFPALLFLLYYRFNRSVVLSPDLRRLICWFSVVVPFGLLNTFWLGEDARLAPLEITRTPQPEISFPVLILAAWLLGKALSGRASRVLAVFAGVASGAVVYCYYYYAVAWAITLCLLLLCGAVWRSRPVWQHTSIVGFVAGITAIPFLLATAEGKAQGGQSYLLARMGAFTHEPDGIALMAGLLIAAMLLLFAEELFGQYPAHFVLALCVAACYFGMNIQVVTGFETQTWHFWKRLALPVAFFLVATCVVRWFDERRAIFGSAVPIASRALLCVLILSTAVRLTLAAIRTAPEHNTARSDNQLLEWVRKHVPANQVIGTPDPQLILLIPALTTDYTYAPSGLRSLTSNKEIVERYDEIACLLGMTAQEVQQAAATPNHLGHSTELMQALGLTYTGDRNVEAVFVRQYASLDGRCPVLRGRLDYLIEDAGTRQDRVRARYPMAVVVYRNPQYKLLTLRSR